MLNLTIPIGLRAEIGSSFYSILKLGYLDFIPGARNWMGILLTVFLSILLGISRHKRSEA